MNFFSLNRSYGVSKNPSFYTDFNYGHLTLVNSASKKFFCSKNRFFRDFANHFWLKLFWGALFTKIIRWLQDCPLQKTPDMASFLPSYSYRPPAGGVGQGVYYSPPPPLPAAYPAESSQVSHRRSRSYWHFCILWIWPVALILQCGYL